MPRTAERRSTDQPAVGKADADEQIKNQEIKEDVPLGNFDPNRPTGWENPRPTGEGEGVRQR